MNSRFIISMSIAIISLGVGFYLLNDVQQGDEKNTQEGLDKKLQASNERLSVIKDDFYNGRYNGDLPKEEVVQIIEAEIATQKSILEEYKKIPSDDKSDKTIDMRFFQLQKYSWAGEESMLRALNESQ
ncbi:MAG: hypothetical protein KC483_05540 [Nitrosarchaeum sp.]|nr:hypothetical protein [Nitrosarchaeum sp.]MCA9820783.1 hypothetical protein [Nitrosarchaeum sp.]